MSTQKAVRAINLLENQWLDGTPLLPIYEKHISQGKSNPEAIEAAGKDVGWLLKGVLARDKRTFIPSKAGLVSHYEWVGNEQ